MFSTLLGTPSLQTRAAFNFHPRKTIVTMHAYRPESATLPRGFHFHYEDGGPKTPEPRSISEPRQPSPPRQTRLKLRRRNIESFGLSVASEPFLASISSADVPIPTIEVPQSIQEGLAPVDSEMSNAYLLPNVPSYRSSPPKTPMPQLCIALNEDGSQRPDWSMPDTLSPAEDIRPCSALSNPSDWSDDSYFSSIRTSRPSDDGSCTSPDEDINDPFVFPSISKGKAIDISQAAPAPGPNIINGHIRSRFRRDAHWSKDMSDHLWQTYQIYLQDPTVTPFRIGTSAVPPDGVVHRVAREAKRSWKGPKAKRNSAGRTVQQMKKLAIDTDRNAMDFTTSQPTKSGSITPTEDIPKGYLQWPHSSAATRQHLRELCKRDFTAVQTHRHFQSRSPTPFTQMRNASNTRDDRPRHNRSQTWSTREFALSLTTSTSDTMRPDGPLASLATSISTEIQTTSSESSNLLGHDLMKDKTQLESLGGAPRSKRLGSPFSARSYGPSSSRSMDLGFGFGTPNASLSGCRAQIDTINVPHLRSPVRFESRPSSLNGTQKRRAQHALDEEMSPNERVLRPSILDEQLFGTPSVNVGGVIGKRGVQRRVRSRGFSLGDEALRNRIPSAFMPQYGLGICVPDTPESLSNGGSAGPSSTTNTPSLLPSATFGTMSFGRSFGPSPVTPNAAVSNTFPRSLFQPTGGQATVRRGQSTTVHHPRRSIESFDFGNGRLAGESVSATGDGASLGEGAGVGLQNRLTLLDQKLAEIRDREETGRKRKDF